MSKNFKKITLVFLSAVLIIMTLVPPLNVQAQTQTRSLNQLTVVIDPGHGGRDPGAVGVHNGVQVRESDVVLDISLQLRNLLRQTGINVHMTRTTDVYVSLAERARIANNRNADLFVSVHLNAFTNSTANGTETYYIGNHGRAAFSEAGLDVFEGEEVDDYVSDVNFLEMEESQISEGDELEVTSEDEGEFDSEDTDYSDEDAIEYSEIDEVEAELSEEDESEITDEDGLDDEVDAPIDSGEEDEEVELSEASEQEIVEDEESEVELEDSDHAIVEDEALALHHGFNPYLNIMPLSNSNRVQNSRLLARSIQSRKVERLGLIDRGVKTANFGVLRETNMAAVLSEIGFLSNPGDRAVMLTPQGRTQSAEALYLGILDYLVATGHDVPNHLFNFESDNARTQAGVTTSAVDFRRGAGSNHERIRRLPKGTEVRILRTSGNWMNIRVGAQEGWVSSQRIATQGRGQTTSSTALRRGAGTSHARIRTLPRGAEVRVLEQSGNWARVRTGGQTGWINARDLRVRLVQKGLRNTASQATFYQGPGSNYREIRRLSAGTAVHVLGRRGNWVRVRQNGQVGYIRVRTIGGAVKFPSNARRGITRRENVRLRAGRGTNHHTIHRFPRGTRLTVLRSSRGWLQVTHGSFTGWVNERDVAMQGRGRTNGRVALRRGRGTNHRRIQTLRRNTNVVILEQRAGWARVRAGRNTGWIRTRDLRITSAR